MATVYIYHLIYIPGVGTSAGVGTSVGVVALGCEENGQINNTEWMWPDSTV